MAIKIKFYGTELSKTDNIDLECYSGNNEIVVVLSTNDDSHYNNTKCIALDKQTAIRLSRELRKQIALID
ncbi:hypothetical protein UFOVP523_36 [uncultured Caudovirales phage]|uniref:Uncharacterized protein n=1 Tax=uncultured Caudovirales phage TaxID=2100421 RepID=A0A6J5MV74_9CAUD|nr:hypothetical protein UFOVP523_36 [uncultured Caudovirales phage]